MYFQNLPAGFGQAPQPKQSPFDQNNPFMKQDDMGYTRGTNGMGIGGVQMRDPGPAAPQLATAAGVPQPPNSGFQMQPPNSGISSTAGLGGKSITPLMPYGRSQAGQAMAAGGPVLPTPTKQRLVAEGIAALNGAHPNPKQALANYGAEFGNDATTELIQHHANGGVVHGPGSGVADLVPGSIDGREDVRIASGEYVVPAWAVAALGDGSSEAGAHILDAMVKKLRKEGSKKIMGTNPINPSKFIPV